MNNVQAGVVGFLLGAFLGYSQGQRTERKRCMAEARRLYAVEEADAELTEEQQSLIDSYLQEGAKIVEQRIGESVAVFVQDSMDQMGELLAIKRAKPGGQDGLGDAASGEQVQPASVHQTHLQQSVIDANVIRS